MPKKKQGGKKPEDTKSTPAPEPQSSQQQERPKAAEKIIVDNKFAANEAKPLRK